MVMVIAPAVVFLPNRVPWGPRKISTWPRSSMLDSTIPEDIDALEKNGKLKENKVIVLTASSAGDVDENELINRGVHVILKKPIELETLLKALEDTQN